MMWSLTQIEVVDNTYVYATGLECSDPISTLRATRVAIEIMKAGVEKNIGLQIGIHVGPIMSGTSYHIISYDGASCRTYQ